jgi:hypothetical protein
MKRVILSIIAVVALCGTSLAWDRRAHATVAKIAENHLTPKTKAALDKYLNGKSIVFYASYADDYKNNLLVDLGYKPSNAERKVTFPHTFEANDDCTVFRGTRKGDKFVKNCVVMADEYAKNLKANHRNMNDSLRVLSIAMLVHWIGDMHCPEHIRYPEDQTTGKYIVKWGNVEVTYHSLWDGILFGARNPWSFTDCAYLLDTCSQEEAAKICKGTIYDWGKEVATISRPIHSIREGAVINRGEYRNQYGPIAEDLVCKAGHRLAKILNEIFD